MEGTLSKLSGKGKWQSRYFVLDAAALAYYPNNKKQKSKGRTVCVIANLTNVTKEVTEKDGTFQIVISSRTGEKYVIKSKTADLSTAWFNAISDAIAAAQPSQPAEPPAPVQSDQHSSQPEQPHVPAQPLTEPTQPPAQPATQPRPPEPPVAISGGAGGNEQVPRKTGKEPILQRKTSADQTKLDLYKGRKVSLGSKWQTTMPPKVSSRKDGERKNVVKTAETIAGASAAARGFDLDADIEPPAPVQSDQHSSQPEQPHVPAQPLTEPTQPPAQPATQPRPPEPPVAISGGAGGNEQVPRKTGKEPILQRKTSADQTKLDLYKGRKVSLGSKWQTTMPPKVSSRTDGERKNVVKTAETIAGASAAARGFDLDADIVSTALVLHTPQVNDSIVPEEGSNEGIISITPEQDEHHPPAPRSNSDLIAEIAFPVPSSKHAGNCEISGNDFFVLGYMNKRSQSGRSLQRRFVIVDVLPQGKAFVVLYKIQREVNDLKGKGAAAYVGKAQHKMTKNTVGAADPSCPDLGTIKRGSAWLKQQMLTKEVLVPAGSFLTESAHLKHAFQLKTPGNRLILGADTPEMKARCISVLWGVIQYQNKQDVHVSRLERAGTVMDPAARMNRAFQNSNLLAEDHTGLWVKNAAAGGRCMNVKCPFAPRAFSLLDRPHHCRICGMVFCAECTANKVFLPSEFGYTSAQRVCDGCNLLLERDAFSTPQEVLETRGSIIAPSLAETKKPAYDAATLRHFDILGLTAAATEEEVTNRYRELMRKLHPDRQKPSEDESVNSAKLARFEEVKRAAAAIKKAKRQAVVTESTGEAALQEVEGERACEICHRPYKHFAGFTEALTSVVKLRHHCRRCGRSVCDSCSPSKGWRSIPAFGYDQQVRHCKECVETRGEDVDISQLIISDEVSVPREFLRKLHCAVTIIAVKTAEWSRVQNDLKKLPAGQDMMLLETDRREKLLIQQEGHSNNQSADPTTAIVPQRLSLIDPSKISGSQEISMHRRVKSAPHTFSAYIPPSHTYEISLSYHAPCTGDDADALSRFNTKVTRSFEDFLWLRRQLTKAGHAAKRLPSFPGAELLGWSDKEQLANRRAQHLQRFFNALLIHPLLKNEISVQGFIAVSDADFKAMREVGLARWAGYDDLCQTLKRVRDTQTLMRILIERTQLSLKVSESRRRAKRQNQREGNQLQRESVQKQLQANYEARVQADRLNVRHQMMKDRDLVIQPRKNREDARLQEQTGTQLLVYIDRGKDDDSRAEEDKARQEQKKEASQEQSILAQAMETHREFAAAWEHEVSIREADSQKWTHDIHDWILLTLGVKLHEQDATLPPLTVPLQHLVELREEDEKEGTVVEQERIAEERLRLDNEKRRADIAAEHDAEELQEQQAENNRWQAEDDLLNSELQLIAQERSDRTRKEINIEADVSSEETQRKEHEHLQAQRLVQQKTRDQESTARKEEQQLCSARSKQHVAETVELTAGIKRRITIEEKRRLRQEKEGIVLKFDKTTEDGARNMTYARMGDMKVVRKRDRQTIVEHQSENQQSKDDRTAERDAREVEVAVVKRGIPHPRTPHEPPAGKCSPQDAFVQAIIVRRSAIDRELTLAQQRLRQETERFENEDSASAEELSRIRIYTDFQSSEDAVVSTHYTHDETEKHIINGEQAIVNQKKGLLLAPIRHTFGYAKKREAARLSGRAAISKANDEAQKNIQELFAKSKHQWATEKPFDYVQAHGVDVRHELMPEAFNLMTQLNKCSTDLGEIALKNEAERVIGEQNQRRVNKHWDKYQSSFKKYRKIKDADINFTEQTSECHERAKEVLREENKELGDEEAQLIKEAIRIGENCDELGELVLWLLEHAAKFEKLRAKEIELAIIAHDKKLAELKKAKRDIDLFRRKEAVRRMHDMEVVSQAGGEAISEAKTKTGFAVAVVGTLGAVAATAALGLAEQGILLTLQLALKAARQIVKEMKKKVLQNWDEYQKYKKWMQFFVNNIIDHCKQNVHIIAGHLLLSVASHGPHSVVVVTHTMLHIYNTWQQIKKVYDLTNKTIEVVHNVKDGDLGRALQTTLLTLDTNIPQMNFESKGVSFVSGEICGAMQIEDSNLKEELAGHLQDYVGNFVEKEWPWAELKMKSAADSVYLMTEMSNVNDENEALAKQLEQKGSFTLQADMQRALHDVVDKLNTLSETHIADMKKCVDGIKWTKEEYIVEHVGSSENDDYMNDENLGSSTTDWGDDKLGELLKTMSVDEVIRMMEHELEEDFSKMQEQMEETMYEVEEIFD